jgi:peptide/nickel transport system substrate-binding protein
LTVLYVGAVALIVFLTGSACAGLPRGAGGGTSNVPQPQAELSPPKRITIVVPNEPPSLYYPLAPATTRGSAGLIYDLVGPGLALSDNDGTLHPLLVDQVPSLDNGQWKLLPDGRMETTWIIRSGAVWHDGFPLTADDLVFTLQVVQDRELAALGNRNFQLIEGAAASGAQSLTLTWSQPYIDADQTFASIAVPMARHLLETAYATNKAGFLDLPYWSSEFVGLGPYALSDWVRGSQMTFRAFDQFVLGRPKIDQIEARFIPDQSTIVSNVLAGSVDVFKGATIGVAQALELRDQWRDGKVNVNPNNWVVVVPQFVDPQPTVVLNVQFRRALLYAVDRQAMADSLMSGLVPVADCQLPPGSREYRATEASLVRYPYDPQRAGQLIEGIGYVRGPDAAFRDTAGQPLSVEIRGAASRDIQVKGLFPVADNWQRVGVATDPVVISAQQASDTRDQATFRAFQLMRLGFGASRLADYHSSEAKLPARNYTGSNFSRYINADVDALIERYQLTVPWDERMRVAGQILHHITDQAVTMPLVYDTDVVVASSRLQNAATLMNLTSGHAWDAQTWDVR